MTLRDTTAGPVTATAAEVRAALFWAKGAAEREAARVTRRDSGLHRDAAKELRTMHLAHSRAICSLFERLGGNQPESLSWIDGAPFDITEGNRS